MNEIVRSPWPPGAPSEQDWPPSGPWPPPPPGFTGPPPGCGPPWPQPPFPPGPPPWFSPPTPPWYPGANAGVSFGTEYPRNPTRGHFLWDGATLWMWDGVSWQKIGPAAPNGTLQLAVVATGTTPPINPITGMLWWNGTTLYVWNGLAWTPTFEAPAPPIIPTPNTSAIVFAIAQPTDVTVSTTQYSIVPLTTAPSVDTQNGYSSATQRYTPNKAGVYIFQARAAIAQVGGFRIVKNDSGSYSPADLVVAAAAESTSGAATATGFTQMNGTTDFVRLWAYDTGGTFPNGGGPAPIFSAVLLA